MNDSVVVPDKAGDFADGRPALSLSAVDFAVVLDTVVAAPPVPEVATAALVAVGVAFGALFAGFPARTLFPSCAVSIPAASVSFSI